MLIYGPGTVTVGFGRRFTSPLVWTALFAVFWAIARAAAQAVTIDEANTYLAFAGVSWPGQWYPAANNHVLNTVLMRLATSVLGLSHLTVRAPALLGAVIYIAAAYCLTKLITHHLKLEWPLFVCLVFNPFIFDYLVAARGYGLAAAFLLCAIAIPYRLREQRLMAGCALSSACAGLSFAANFSFGIVDAATLLVVFFWAWHRESTSRRLAQLLTACTLPAAFITLILSAPALLGFPKTDLTYGATSWGETLHTVVSSSFYELNPNIVNPLLYPALAHATRFLFPLLAIVCVYQLIIFIRNRARIEDRHVVLLAVLSGIGLLTFAAHWISFEMFQLLLPKERTALFFVPLATLIAGVLASVSIPGRAAKFGKMALTILFYIVATYFLLCLRLSYFKEWRYDGDVKNVYSVLSYYNHAFGVRNIASNWMYVPSLNFYRRLSGHETIAEFADSHPYPQDRSVYVLYEPDDRAFLEAQKLKVVYRGDLSDVVVAIRPEAESTPR